MPRQKGALLENKFIRGLITENQALSFPSDACTDTDNCIFKETGVIYRRKGIDLELGQAPTTVTISAGDAFTEFVWDYVGSSSTTSFLVQQRGNTLHFFDLSTSTTVSSHYAGSVDTSTYVFAVNQATAAKSPRQYAQGRGKLFVVCRYHGVLSIEYSSGFSVSLVPVQYRDFEGLEDEYPLSTRPTATISGLVSTAPKHYYNILNQGWHHLRGASLTAWDTFLTTLPSNADVVGYFRGDNTDTFKASLVAEHDPGNSPAPKGHFILEAGIKDRYGAVLLDDFLEVAVPQDYTQTKSVSGYANIGDFTNPANAFDANTGTSATKTSVTSGYIGKQLSSADYISLVFVNMTPSADGTLYLYGSNSAPSSYSNGTLLGELPFTLAGKTSGSTVYAVKNTNHLASNYLYYWIAVVNASAANMSIAEITFIQYKSDVQYPSTVAFLNGRAFYGGYTQTEYGTKLFFTQVIEQDEQYGHCYQRNDPTSDEISDLYPSDGGVINIPEIAQIHKLFAFRDQLLILATNGVWVINGGSGPFSASNYSVSRISSTGTTSPMSVVDVKGLPVWWAEDGIYTVEFDPNYNSVRLKNITEETIKTFYLEIPSINRSSVKGCYDRSNDTVIWLYNDSAALTSDDYFKYTRALRLNMKTAAFYPWSFTTSAVQPQYIQGVVYIQDKARAQQPTVKFTTTYSSNRLTYSEERDTSYVDWDDYSTLTGNVTDKQDYSSYLVSGYRVDGKGTRKFQSNYVSVFLKRESGAGGYVQGLYQFADSGDSGKWSTPQFIYNSAVDRGQGDHTVKIARLKLRGSGDALQLKIYSESYKPFSIIGWGLNESVNADI